MISSKPATLSLPSPTSSKVPTNVRTIPRRKRLAVTSNTSISPSQRQRASFTLAVKMIDAGVHLAEALKIGVPHQQRSGPVHLFNVGGTVEK